MRQRRDVSGVLRIGVCGIGEQRITTKENAGGPEIRPQGVLRIYRRRSSAVRQVHRPNTDYCDSNGNSWPGSTVRWEFRRTEISL